MATTPVFFPGEFHGQRSHSGLQFIGLQRVRHNWVTTLSQIFIYTYIISYDLFTQFTFLHNWILSILSFMASRVKVLPNPKNTFRKNSGFLVCFFSYIWFFFFFSFGVYFGVNLKQKLSLLFSQMTIQLSLTHILKNLYLFIFLEIWNLIFNIHKS